MAVKIVRTGPIQDISKKGKIEIIGVQYKRKRKIKDNSKVMALTTEIMVFHFPEYMNLGREQILGVKSNSLFWHVEFETLSEYISRNLSLKLKREAMIGTF